MLRPAPIKPAEDNTAGIAMYSKDYTDIVGGLVLICLGLVFSAYAATHYDIGTIRRMGPGMFPTILGVALAIFGAAQIVPALRRAGNKPDIRVWTPIFVLGACGVFALMLRSCGLIPAVITLTVVASLAELEIRPLRMAAISAILCLASWLIFVVAFGLNVPIARWPF